MPSVAVFNNYINNDAALFTLKRSNGKDPALRLNLVVN